MAITLSMPAVSLDVGFLPLAEPLRRLTPSFESWELLLEEAHFAVQRKATDDDSSRNWRSKVAQSPLISIEELNTVELLRRAHVVLSYLGHYYIHSTTPPTTNIPKSLAKPWLEVSAALEIPPVLTFADTVLYNWRFKDAKLGFQIDNIEMVETFTGLESERWFYFTSFLVEMFGAPALTSMVTALQTSPTPSDSELVAHFRDIERVTRIITPHLDNVRAHCIPSEFFWKIRPYFNGGTWTFEGAGENGADEIREVGGPSAGQSTMIHILDVFLGVDHTPARLGNQAVHRATKPGGPDSTFAERMQLYMPKEHREFLQETQLRRVAAGLSGRLASSAEDSLLRQSHNGAVMALKELRDSHMRIATLYIITQSRQPPPEGTVFLTASAGATGTGGTALVPFLKECRVRTVEALR